MPGPAPHSATARQLRARGSAHGRSGGSVCVRGEPLRLPGWPKAAQQPAQRSKVALAAGGRGPRARSAAHALASHCNEGRSQALAPPSAALRAAAHL